MSGLSQDFKDELGRNSGASASYTLGYVESCVRAARGTRRLPAYVRELLDDAIRKIDEHDLRHGSPLAASKRSATGAPR